MRIESDQEGIILKDVFNGVGFKTAEGEHLGVCMRDFGYDISTCTKEGVLVWYHAQAGEIVKHRRETLRKLSKAELKIWQTASSTVLQYGLDDKCPPIMVGKAMDFLRRIADYVRKYGLSLDSIDIELSFDHDILDIEANTNGGHINYEITETTCECFFDTRWPLWNAKWSPELVCDPLYMPED